MNIDVVFNVFPDYFYEQLDEAIQRLNDFLPSSETRDDFQLTERYRSRRILRVVENDGKLYGETIIAEEYKLKTEKEFDFTHHDIKIGSLIISQLSSDRIRVRLTDDTASEFLDDWGTQPVYLLAMMLCFMEPGHRLGDLIDGPFYKYGKYFKSDLNKFELMDSNIFEDEKFIYVEPKKQNAQDSEIKCLGNIENDQKTKLLKMGMKNDYEKPIFKYKDVCLAWVSRERFGRENISDWLRNWETTYGEFITKDVFKDALRKAGELGLIKKVNNRWHLP